MPPPKESEARKPAEKGEAQAAKLSEKEARIGRLEAAAEAAAKEAESLKSKLGKGAIQIIIDYWIESFCFVNHKILLLNGVVPGNIYAT